ncbi:succinylglutamate desuccinylase/aspartoacylase family protein [Immundisolibacter sp.]|uniref:succinylglutamate desuccinylase/aspartoacylase family protein n=2 Tax=Immundisolibacter sp. TaxID=1934948 RepID=UPI0035666E10
MEPFKLLGSEVPPGEVRQLSWFANQHYSGVESAAQVLVAHGSKPGKVLCVTAAIHGDEINGVEIARRVFYRTKPKSLAGTLVVVPITNLHGFERSYRYLADRRDLNRYFPGIVDGSSAARIAHSFFTSVIEHCDALVDLHTGSFHRTNLPQLRADLSKKKVVHLTHGFGATAVLDDKGAIGTLRRAATDAGIPAVVLEAGEPMRLQPDEVRHGAKAVKSLMAHLRMVKKSWRWRDPQPVYYESVWVRASRGGILMAAVQLGDSVSAGQSLGAVTDPISNSRSQVIAPQAGRVIGMAVNQMVRPGYAVFRIGIERTEAEIVETAAQPSTDDSSATPVTTSPAATSDPAQDDITDDASSDTDHSDE